MVVETLARSRNRPLLYFMVFRDNVLAGRFCWRRGLPYGPYAYTGPIVFHERGRCAAARDPIDPDATLFPH